MSRKSGSGTEKTSETAVVEQPRCKAIADAGIRSTGDIMRLEAAMISDIISGRVDVQSANAVTGKCGNMLKAEARQYARNVADGRVANRDVLLTE